MRVSRAGPRMADRGGPTEQELYRSERAAIRLAREGVGSGAIFVDWTAVFASKLRSYRLFQVTRRQGGTLSRHYRRNGYVLSQQRTGRLSGRLRE
ncbi:hypothetical protein CES87_22915 [Pseudomonas sp. ERMR1:02]|nr:hypothetical protein CES87_22915 [Pseudomonas sp. ERMR1:02]